MKIYPCELCGKPVPDYVPEYCCRGEACGCGCMGLPIEPCVCSKRCETALFQGIGTSFEERRIAAGIERWAPSRGEAVEPAAPER